MSLDPWWQRKHPLCPPKHPRELLTHDSTWIFKHEDHPASPRLLTEDERGPVRPSCPVQPRSAGPSSSSRTNGPFSPPSTYRPWATRCTKGSAPFREIQVFISKMLLEYRPSELRDGRTSVLSRWKSQRTRANRLF